MGTQLLYFAECGHISIMYEHFSNTCLHTTFQGHVVSNFSISEIRMAGIIRDKKIKLCEYDLEDYDVRK
jgi:hypothetical protein